MLFFLSFSLDLLLLHTTKAALYHLSFESLQVLSTFSS